jgi:hypothetical protein
LFRAVVVSGAALACQRHDAHGEASAPSFAAAPQPAVRTPATTEASAPTADEPLREALAECVPRLLAANLRGWLTPDSELGASGAPEHGMVTLAAARGAVFAAVRDVVLPGFEHVGVRLDASARGATQALLGQLARS